MRKILAFTLAETLIVMGIIGIVSALTLPNLNSSIGDKDTVTRVKKLYSDINDAYGRAIAVYGPMETWFINDTSRDAQSTRFFNRITEFMKLSKVNASNWSGVLADGSEIWINKDSFLNNQISYVVVNIDVDGPNKGKNVPGIDIFYFTTSKSLSDSNTTVIIDTSELRPYYIGGGSGKMTNCSLRYDQGPNSYSAGAGCTRWVVDYGNLDYLKTDSSNKCPNGTVLNYLANPPVVSCK